MAVLVVLTLLRPAGSGHVPDAIVLVSGGLQFGVLHCLPGDAGRTADALLSR